MMLRKALYLAQIYRRQWWPRERLEALGRERLTAIVRHAYTHVPYYRRRFDEAGIGARILREPVDLRALPFTHKQDLAPLDMRDRVDDRLHPEDLRIYRSSGSSGEPFHIPANARGNDLRGAAIGRMYLTHGVKPGTNIALFAVTESVQPPIGIVPKAFRYHWIPVRDSFDAQLEILHRLQAPVYEGYPSDISQMAQIVLDRGITNLRPKHVFVNSEPFPQEARATIRAAFGCEATNVYDTWEFGSIAWECPEHHRLHVNVDLLAVEVLVDGEPAPPGVPGDLVLTDLNNVAAPMIRYPIRDLAVWSDEPCPCGRTLPVFERLEGRESAQFVREDGSRISATFILCTWMNKYPQVTAFQGIQRERGKLDLYIKPAPGRFQNGDADRIAASLAGGLGIPHVNVIIDDAVNPRTKAGKLMPFVCEIPD